MRIQPVTWAVLPVMAACAAGLAVVGQPGIGIAFFAIWIGLAIYDLMAERSRL